MTRRARVAMTATCSLVLATSLGAPSVRAEGYGYSIADPLLATVIGVSREESFPLPDRLASNAQRIGRVNPAPIPRVFWDQEDLRFSLSRQRRRAPLVFLIAGTGSRYSSAKTRFLEALLWSAGHHVAVLSSPTHPDFILTATRNHMPGYMPADVADLYALMKRVRDTLAEEVEISTVSVAGFSLGATQAAFLAAHDARRRELDFRRVLLINPAVSVFDSVAILDRMFDESLPDGAESSDRLISDLLRRFTPYLHERSRNRVDDEFLYALAGSEDVSGRELGAIISTVFRLSLANMVFTADVMTGGGRVVEAGVRPGASSPLTLYLKRATRFTFGRYLDEMLLPYWRARVPELDRDSLVADSSLEAIAPYLRAASHVGVMTNTDDFILTGAHLEFLRRTFGERAKIFPRGGHGGNLAYRDNAEHVLEFFAIGPDGSRP